MLLIRHMRTATYLWLIACGIPTEWRSVTVVCAAEWPVDCMCGLWSISNWTLSSICIACPCALAKGQPEG